MLGLPVLLPQGGHSRPLKIDVYLLLLFLHLGVCCPVHILMNIMEEVPITVCGKCFVF